MRNGLSTHKRVNVWMCENEIDNTAEVILYGSRARGDDKQDSDWDVMILLKQKNVDEKVEQTHQPLNH